MSHHPSLARRPKSPAVNFMAATAEIVMSSPTAARSYAPKSGCIRPSVHAE